MEHDSNSQWAIPTFLVHFLHRAWDAGYSLIWPIQGRAAGQGMVLGLFVLNKVYNFMRVCPKQVLSCICEHYITDASRNS